MSPSKSNPGGCYLAPPLSPSHDASTAIQSNTLAALTDFSRERNARVFWAALPIPFPANMLRETFGSVDAAFGQALGIESQTASARARIEQMLASRSARRDAAERDLAEIKNLPGRDAREHADRLVEMIPALRHAEVQLRAALAEPWPGREVLATKAGAVAMAAVRERYFAVHPRLQDRLQRLRDDGLALSQTMKTFDADLTAAEQSTGQRMNLGSWRDADLDVLTRIAGWLEVQRVNRSRSEAA